MANNIEINKGQAKDLKFDRGSTLVNPGPYIGIVKNSIDTTLSGRLRVYIPEMASQNETDSSTWTTCSYLSPFYGITPNTGSKGGAGTFEGSRQSYGFWATPPDEGTRVMVIFVYGDPNQAFYIGCIPEPGYTHMIPAIGASSDPNSRESGDFDDFYSNDQLPSILQGKPLLPTTELNDKNSSIVNDPKYYTREKAVHQYQAVEMLQQGIIDDPQRGPITTNSQRESPSRVFGISTPGQPVYKAKFSNDEIEADIDSGQVTQQQLEVIARVGGHTLAMDDGDLSGKNKLFRLRSSQGHQILMNDSDSFLHIINKKGDVWIEFNREGALDIYAENSINLRTAGTLNLHADKDININAEGQIRMRSKGAMNLETQDVFNLRADKNINVYTQATFEVKADGTLLLEAGGKGSWKCGGELRMDASLIALNSGGSETVPVVPELVKNSLPDTEFDGSNWIIQKDVIQTVATRAPTHEPYPMHNYGVDTSE
jgi:hypothetical protein